jgi:hypothetical protein
MVSFKVVYRCNTCNKDLVAFGGFNNLTEIGRIQIPIDQVKCIDCETDNRSIVLVGPGQPEYKRALSNVINVHSGAMLCGQPWYPQTQVRLRREV